MKTIRTFFVLAERKILTNKGESVLRVSAILKLDCELDNVYSVLNNHWYFFKAFAELESQYSNIKETGSIFLSNINLLGVEHD